MCISGLTSWYWISLGKTNSPLSIPLFIACITSPRVESISFPLSMMEWPCSGLLEVVIWLKSHGWSFPVISRRHNLTTFSAVGVLCGTLVLVVLYGRTYLSGCSTVVEHIRWVYECMLLVQPRHTPVKLLQVTNVLGIERECFSLILEDGGRIVSRCVRRISILLGELA